MRRILPGSATRTTGAKVAAGNLVGATVSTAAMRRTLGSVVVLLSISACTHGATTTGRGAAPFADASALGVDDREVDRLATLERGDARARAVRLERLLDLFDAARLAGDDDARDVLWQALDGHASGRGVEATRDALTRLLAEATALDDLGVADDDARSFVNDAITLLTTDLQTPTDSDGLAVRTLAYRMLATQGHPRIRDNAHWRLYDHIRGTLTAAVSRPPEGRTDVAIQAQYAARDGLEAELADTGVHDRPRWDGGPPLEALLDEHRVALAAEPAWAAAITARTERDRELADAVLATLPAPRTATWTAPLRPRGTGRAESLAPVVHLSAGRADVDAGRPQARALPLDDDDITALGDAVRDALAQDGRGTMLLRSDANLPAPELRRALRAIRRGNAARVEFTLLEPHSSGGTVATVLPVAVVRATKDATTVGVGVGVGVGATAASLGDARIHVHLGGRGLEFALDGKWLPGIAGDTDEITRRLASIHAAYPRERTVRLTFGPDLLYEQIIDALVAMIGGAEPRFAAAGWLPDESKPAGTADLGLEQLLRDRMAWAAVGTIAIDQPFPLAGDDQQRLRSFADALPRCLPELGPRPSKPRPVELRITIAQGRVQPITPPKLPGVGLAGVTAMTACLQNEGYGLRLREHRDTMSITLRGG